MAGKELEKASKVAEKASKEFDKVPASRGLDLTWLDLIWLDLT